MMSRFLARRLLLIPLALLLVNFFGYTYAHYAGPLRAERTPYVRAVEAGPLLPAYVTYLERSFNLDFGLQLAIPGEIRGGSVSLGNALWSATQASFGLLVIALLVSAVIGLVLGMSAVRNSPPGVSRWLVMISTVGLAMPSFYIGSLFIFGSVMYVLRIGPGTQMPLPISGFGWDAHLILPVVALMARPTVQLAQTTASLLSGELSKQYITAARSIGHSWRSARNRAAMWNIIAPIVLTLGTMLRLLVGELILVEWLFRWPGLGRLLAWTLVPPQLTSSSGSPLFLNPPVVASLLTVIGALFLVADFITAISARALDPRLRQTENEVGDV
jgi:ABC-type dipeptide/oligopeptide/nickel transport system permease component